ncbi:MAG: N-acetyltransferase [Nevskia sp.]|nr:N-acetyltransferase [Nevskia sp.]
MTQQTNALGQGLDRPVPDWQAPSPPPRKVMQGHWCRLEPLDAERHARPLYEAFALDAEGRNWTYLPYGPYDSFDSYRAWVESAGKGPDPLFFAIVDLASGRAVGVASFMRIDPSNGSIEVGGLNFSPLLQGRPAATEAMFLMMQRAFALGYRRYEWKCNALNAPSRSAALRLGFSFEGVFRQATVVKGRNRDTAWYSVVDGEWPKLQEAFLRWLAPDNFDTLGLQKLRLSDLTAAVPKIASVA